MNMQPQRLAAWPRRAWPSAVLALVLASPAGARAAEAQRSASALELRSPDGRIAVTVSADGRTQLPGGVDGTPV
jgi:hypothetical protein